MKIVLIIVLTLATKLLFSQDTSATWINKIEKLSFKVYHGKRHIRKEMFSSIGIERKIEIARRYGYFSKGCRGLRHKRLNWLAKDKDDHYILSISNGGRFYGTRYFFMEYNKEKLKVEELLIAGDLKMTFTEMVNVIKARFNSH
jgi:hypothetical protein